MAIQDEYTLDLLNTHSAPHLSYNQVDRYNRLVNFLNGLSIENRNALQQANYFAMVIAFHKQAATGVSNYDLQLQIMEQGYDNWARLELAKGNAVSQRPQQIGHNHGHVSQSSFFQQPTQRATTQVHYHRHDSDDSCCNTYQALAIGSLVLGIVGVAIALEPIAWLIGIAILAANPPAFTFVVSVYAAAVATCFIAAATFAIMGSEPEVTPSHSYK